MDDIITRPYITSVQPFWDATLLENITDSNHVLTASRMDWHVSEILSVPGNGQVGLAVTTPEDIRGRVYGVMTEAGPVNFSGMENSIMLRFAPASFSKLVHIPLEEIDPNTGIDMEDVFNPRQLDAIRDAAANENSLQALFVLFSRWMELDSSGELLTERNLANHMTKLIWSRQGNIHVKELEQESGYSSRHLQSVFLEKVGLSPKQMCRQVRFQSALRGLLYGNERNLANIAASLGYSDQAHLSREFREFTGMTPGEFRKQHL